MQDLDRSGLGGSNYCSNSLETNFFQSRDFQRVLQNIGWRTIKLEVQGHECSADILAFAPTYIPIFHSLFPHYRVQYGPCIQSTSGNIDNSVLKSLLKSLSSALRENGAVFVEVRTPFPFPCGYKAFQQDGFSRVVKNGEYSVIIDLRKESRMLWKGMKRFARRSVKKALSKGVEVRSVETENELHQFYRLYLDTASRRGFRPQPYAFFKAMWTLLEPKGLVKFLVAWLDKRAIGGIMNTFFAEESTPYFACSLREFWDCCPNHLLFWHSIEWSNEVAGSSTFKLYHLPSRRERSQGIDYHSFKTCFGGILVEECTFYQKIISPHKLRITKLLLDTFSPGSRLFFPLRMFGQTARHE